MSGLVGMLVEAWDELRIHRLRVLLSLIGVAAAVTAITGVTAAVQMLNQAFSESSERGAGRAVTLNAYAWPSGRAGVVPATAEQIGAEYDRIIERYDVTYSTRNLGDMVRFRLSAGSTDVNVQAVDADYGTIQRFVTTQGRWFAQEDTERYAPALVVNQSFLDALGVTDLSSHPTALWEGVVPVRTEVVGVYPNSWVDEPPSAYVLYDQYVQWAAPARWGAQPPNLQVWVPPEMADELWPLIKRDLTAALPGADVDVQPPYDPGAILDGATRWVALGVGAFALLLGGLGLVNIALVTVRHRIREIGIRRSFGATSGRVFFGVLLESVVATVVAGAVGVVIAVAAIKAIPVDKVFGSAIEDMPPFPVAAALTGLACAAGVGALAGLIPAIVAVRVKVIDAIRY